jgi:hypothetical protein
MAFLETGDDPQRLPRRTAWTILGAVVAAGALPLSAEFAGYLPSHSGGPLGTVVMGILGLAYTHSSFSPPAQ